MQDGISVWAKIFLGVPPRAQIGENVLSSDMKDEMPQIVMIVGFIVVPAFRREGDRYIGKHPSVGHPAQSGQMVCSGSQRLIKQGWVGPHQISHQMRKAISTVGMKRSD